MTSGSLPKNERKKEESRKRSTIKTRHSFSFTAEFIITCGKHETHEREDTCIPEKSLGNQDLRHKGKVNRCSSLNGGS